MQIKERIYIYPINQNNYPPKNTAVKQNTKQQCFFYSKAPSAGINYFTGNITNSRQTDRNYEKEKNDITELCKTIEEEEDLDLSRIIKILNKDNILLAKKLLEDETFPRHEVYPIISKTNTDNLNLSERLCEDTKVPRYLISQILKATTKENISLAESMYLTRNFPLIMVPSLLNNIEVKEINFRDQAGFSYFAKMYRQCMKNPGIYINSNGSSSNNGQEIIYRFFERHGRELLKLASLEDSELNDILLRKRIADMKDYLKIIDQFLPKHMEIIKEGLKCKTPSGKELTPPEKAELIDIVNDYKLLHKGFNNLESCINKGVIDINKIKKEIIYDIFKNTVYNDTKRNLLDFIPEEKLLAWDVNFAYLLAPQLKKDNFEISTVIKLANQSQDFKTILLDPNEKISQINLLTKEKFEENGLNYENWLNPNKNNAIRIKATDQYASQTHRIAEQFCLNVNELLKTPVKSFINKKYQKYIEKEELKLPDGIAKNKSKLEIFMKNFNTELEPVWRRAESNEGSSEQEKRRKALNTLTIKDHIEALIDSIEHISENKEIHSVNLTVKMWDRIPQHDLFQGNYSTCCIGMNRSNAAAMGTYLTNTTFNMIELIDNTSGKTVGNALCYYIKTEDNPALVIDNIEINNSFMQSEMICKQIRTGITEYAKNINEEVCGNRNIPIYLGNQNNDVPINDLKRVRKINSQIMGQVCLSGKDQIYLDAMDGWNTGYDIGKEIELKNMLQLN